MQQPDAAPSGKQWGILDLPGLFKITWQLFREDPVVRRTWMHIRWYVWIGFVIQFAMTLIQYLQMYLMVDSFSPSSIFFLIAIGITSCLGGLYIMVLFFFALFVYPRRAYRKTFLDNPQLRMVPMSFRQRYGAVMVPFLIGFAVVTSPGFLTALVPPWLLIDISALADESVRDAFKVTLTGYISSQLMMVTGTLLSLFAVPAVAHRGMLALHAPNPLGVGTIFHTLAPLLLYIFNLIGVMLYSSMSGFSTHFAGHVHPVGFTIYMVFAIVLVIIASRLYFRDIERIRRVCFQPEE